jgi:hypothetical protein
MLIPTLGTVNLNNGHLGLGGKAVAGIEQMSGLLAEAGSIAITSGESSVRTVGFLAAV